MELNNRLKEIIQDEIKNFSLEQLKGKKSPESAPAKSDYDKIKEAEAESKDVDNILFFGGDDPETIKKSKQRYIKENEEPAAVDNQSEDPRITQTEIDQFEKDFREKVSPLVQFSSKDDGAINFKLYKGEAGIEARISGVIPISGDSKVEWSFSLQEGSYVNMSSELTTEVAEVLNKMAFFYEEWKREWTEKLTELPADKE